MIFQDYNDFEAANEDDQLKAFLKIGSSKSHTDEIGDLPGTDTSQVCYIKCFIFK